MNAGEAYRHLIANTAADKLTRQATDTAQEVNVPKEKMPAFMVLILRDVIAILSDRIRVDLDEKEVDDIAYKIVEHRFAKGR